MSFARRFRFVALAALAASPSFAAPYVGAAMSSLLPAVDLDHAYFTTAQPLLLYAVMPATVLGSFVLVMAPGLLAALLVGRPRSYWQWLLDGFALSLLLVSVPAAVVQAAIGRPLTGAGFAALAMAEIAAAGVLLWRKHGSGATASAFTSPPPAAGVAATIIVPIALLIALTPKVFWEAFNGDGAHMMEATRLLLFKPLPFFPAEAGGVTGWPGVNGMVVPYPASWFLRLFGEVEAAVRLPALLLLPILVASMAAVAEAGRSTRLDRGGIALLWASGVSFTLVMTFSATYDPYNADMSMPAPMDTLVMLAIFAAVAAFIDGDRWRLLVWTLGALMASPAASVTLAALLAASAVAARPFRWMAAARYGAGLVGCVVALGVAQRVAQALGLVVGGGEHSPVKLLLRQFAFIAVADVERVAWAALAGGLYPMAAVLAWRHSDRSTRALLVASGGLFLFYYVMGTVSLHYFVAVMLLPVAAFWREHRTTAWPWPATAAAWLAAGTALWVGLPTGTAIYDGTRVVGEHLDVSTFDGYHAGDFRAVGATETLGTILPTDMDPRVPDERYGGSPLAWGYYAQHADAASPKAYRLLPPGAAAPPGATLVAENDFAALFVTDHEVWRRDQQLSPRHSRGHRLYEIPRWVLFYDPVKSARPGFFSPGNWVRERLPSLGSE